MNEKRLFSRITSALEVDVTLDTGEELAGRLTNLSMRGLFVESDASAPIGTHCSVVLYPAGREHRLMIEIEGSIARCENGGIGVRFNEFCYEAFERLRAMVASSADDSEKIDAEIEEHLIGRQTQ